MTHPPEGSPERHLTIITTGGTIEKTYDEHTGELTNRRSILPIMLRRLRLEATRVNVIELMSKDSLEMDDADRRRIVETVHAVGGTDDLVTETTGIVILHGTDRLAETGAALCEAIPEPRVPIVLTGAMRPFTMKRSDALQNLTETLFAAGMLTPGVYCVSHGRALRFPGVVKDRVRLTFTVAP